MDLAFFAYCSGEATCFLWTSSYFAGAKEGLTDGMIASFGSLIFGGLMLFNGTNYWITAEEKEAAAMKQ